MLRQKVTNTRWERKARARGDEGCVSGGGSRVVFHHLVCPFLQRSAGVTHRPSARPHITHSCVDEGREGIRKKEAKMKTRGERELQHTRVGINCGKERKRENKKGRKRLARSAKRNRKKPIKLKMTLINRRDDSSVRCCM